MGIANTTAGGGADRRVHRCRGGAWSPAGAPASTMPCWRARPSVVAAALALHRPDPADPVGVLAAVGGLEHAALAGFILGAAARARPGGPRRGDRRRRRRWSRRRCRPDAVAALVAGHRSAEPGASVALAHLGLRPLLDLGLRLGEGTGAVLALPLVGRGGAGAARGRHLRLGGSARRSDRWPYPLGLLLDGRRVLVVGGGDGRHPPGPRAARRPAPTCCWSRPRSRPALHGLAGTGQLRWLAAPLRAGRPRRRVAGARGGGRSGGGGGRVARRRSSAGSSASEPTTATQASAWTPAVTRHGPVTVAVLGGRRPGGRWRYGTASATGWPSGRSPTRATIRGSRRHAAGHRAGVALVGGGPGDPELITVKGRRLLAEADVVVVDRLAPGLLLDELRPDVELVDASKIPYGPAACPGGDQPVAGGPGPSREVRGPAQGRRPVRLRPRRRGGARLRRGRACR